MLLPEPLDPTSAVVVPAGALKVTCFSTGTPGLYSKLTSSNTISPSICASGARVLSSSSSVFMVHQLVDAIEAGERFADLRADRRDLDDRRGHQSGEEDVVDEVAERHRGRRGSRGRRRRS